MAWVMLKRTPSQSVEWRDAERWASKIMAVYRHLFYLSNAMQCTLLREAMKVERSVDKAPPRHCLRYSDTQHGSPS